ncbi:MAG TPA: histidine kinase [Longimicrobiales bacterium]|nr:histidine kinase [Longimicrobiales bacterium]
MNGVGRAARAPGLQRRDRLLILAFWTVFGLLESSSAFVNMRLAGNPADWPTALVGNMPWWLMWGALTPLAIFVARRFRFDRDGWVVAGSAHFLAAFLAVALHTIVVGTLYYLTHTRGLVFPVGQPTTLTGPFFVQTLRNTWVNFMRTYLVVNLATYWVIVGGYYAFEFYRRYRDEELRATRMREHLTEARLNALRMELNPHFLFNTLNAISGLVRRSENEAAVRVLARLGDLLRLTLERGGDHRVPLEEELELLRVYLEIERVRFHDRLSVDVQVDDAALDGMVPTLILQPLVENAVRHGVAPLPDAGRIRVGAQRLNGDLVLEVADSGEGFARLTLPEPSPDGGGVGLSNTQARLAELYGDRARMTLGVAPEGGGLVRIVLPYEPLSGTGAGRETLPRSGAVTA